MANPNIVGVTDIRGKTAVQNVITSAAALVSNTAGSNKVFKINSILISNIDGLNSADITVQFARASVNTNIASTVTVPADATLVVLSKDTPLYLEEGDAINCFASANGDLQAICSYEEIA